MTDYLIKTYDAKGRLIDRFAFAAPNDDEAEAAVVDLGGDTAQELWSGRRWVRSWPAPFRRRGPDEAGQGERPA